MRPTHYIPEIGTKIVEQMSEGKTLLEICKDDEMPGRATIYRWAELHDDFRETLTRARHAQAHFYFEKMMEVAFNRRDDFFVDGDKVVGDHVRVARDRLIVDTLKFASAKLLPRAYGESPIGEAAPVQQVTRIERIIIEPERGAEDAPLTPRQLTYQPPEPGDLTVEQWGTLRQLLDMIDRAVGERPADEVFDVLKAALLDHFRD